ncbi:hypothetical protein [Streptomyces canus]|uniref:hypothetical protein n=1 Tax=Streptomyces canus TaxID=58343 RepID=UPI002DD9EB19|nr:hypothetical protein [Streptomyces canus]WSD83157.1 hypothetical protein OG925_01930 [Streptomyces canus]
MGVVHLGHNPRTPRTSWTAAWTRRSTACGCARDHVRPVAGVDYDQVVTEKLEKTPQSAVREVVGESCPSRWVLAKLHEGHGRARPVLHAPDCTHRTAKKHRRARRCSMTASKHAQAQAAEIAHLRRRLRDNRHERQRLQDEVDAAATVIAALIAENAALRDQLAKRSAVVAPLDRGHAVRE